MVSLKPIPRKVWKIFEWSRFKLRHSDVEEDTLTLVNTSSKHEASKKEVMVYIWFHNKEVGGWAIILSIKEDGWYKGFLIRHLRKMWFTLLLDYRKKKSYDGLTPLLLLSLLFYFRATIFTLFSPMILHFWKFKDESRILRYNPSDKNAWLSSWNKSIVFCFLEGVTCDVKSCEVISLDFINNTYETK